MAKYSGRIILPPTEDTLLAYIGFLFCETKNLAKTMSGKVSAVASYYLENEAFDIKRDAMKRLKRALKGVEKLRKSKYRGLPLLTEMLDDCLKQLPQHSKLHKVIRAALLLAQRALLRCSEYTVSTQSQWQDPNSHRSQFTLLWSDLKWIPTFNDPKFLAIQLKRTKTTQLHTIERVVKCQCPISCAVHAVKQLVPKEGLHCGSDPVFQWSKQRVLSRNKLDGILKSLLRKAGYAADKYSTHSLRRGGATDLKRRGVDDSVIKAMGGWKSNAVFAYIVLQPHEIADLAY